MNLNFNRDSDAKDVTSSISKGDKNTTFNDLKQDVIDEYETSTLFDDSDIQNHMGIADHKRFQNQNLDVLDLKLANVSKNINDSKSSQIEIQEQMVTLIFQFSDESQDESVFKLGQTIEYVKSFIEFTYGIPMSQQQLYCGSICMMDPLSILDYFETDVEGSLNKSQLTIRVEGSFSLGFRK